jgi:hypothetical protein
LICTKLFGHFAFDVAFDLALDLPVEANRPPGLLWPLSANRRSQV